MHRLVCESRAAAQADRIPRRVARDRRRFTVSRREARPAPSSLPASSVPFASSRPGPDLSRRPRPVDHVSRSLRAAVTRAPVGPFSHVSRLCAAPMSAGCSPPSFQRQCARAHTRVGSCTRTVPLTLPSPSEFWPATVTVRASAGRAAPGPTLSAVLDLRSAAPVHPTNEQLRRPGLALASTCHPQSGRWCNSKVAYFAYLWIFCIFCIFCIFLIFLICILLPFSMTHIYAYNKDFFLHIILKNIFVNIKFFIFLIYCKLLHMDIARMCIFAGIYVMQNPNTGWAPVAQI